MKKWMKVAGLTVAVAALGACSNDNGKPQSNDQAASQQAATDALQTKFVSVATGGASGPYNVIGTSLAEIYHKTYGVNSKTQTTGASV